MSYTVSQIAKRLGIPASTLRYYDKEGLLPFLKRSPGGSRAFEDSDLEWLRLIQCMKQARMPLKEIRQYIQLVEQGNETYEKRTQIFERQRKVLLEQMAQLQHTLKLVDYKCWYYAKIQELGNEQAVMNLKEEDIPLEYREARNFFCSSQEFSERKELQEKKDS